jgi:hypothetical protein
MELKEITPFILMIIAVGLLLGAGIVTLDAFSSSAPGYNIKGLNFTITNIGNYSATAIGRGNLTSVNYVYFLQSQTAVNSTCYVVDTTNGSIKVNTANGVPAGSCGNFEKGTATVNLSVGFDYNDANTKTRLAIDNINEGIQTISSNWITLLITIVVLSIIITVVVNSFGFNSGGIHRR